MCRKKRERTNPYLMTIEKQVIDLRNLTQEERDTFITLLLKVKEHKQFKKGDNYEYYRE